MAFKARFREFMMEYGKVAMGVHFSVSAASITGLYVAINNNVDVESFVRKLGITTDLSKEENLTKIESSVPTGPEIWDGFVIEERNELPHISMEKKKKKKKNRTPELAASSGGALALALVCNKVLLPVRLPITVILTPPVARFLARRRI